MSRAGGAARKKARVTLPDEDMFVFDEDAPRGHSVPLIIFDNDTFTVSEEALELLQKIEGAVAVITVAGLYRTGKSFLLNRIILAKQNGFSVGPTTQACTKGIWMWSETLEVNGMQVIVVDTEGIGAPTADATHDTRIFALGLLLSTYFIYNSVGSIDEQALTNLSLVTNLSKQIRTTGDNESADYPGFLWVVRDFALQLKNQQGDTIESHEYLEEALRDCESGNNVAAKNKIRQCLRDFFPERDCFTLVRPCTNESHLQTLDQLPNKVLRPEFLQQAAELREHIFTEASKRPYKVNNVFLNGSMLAMMCKQYVDAINEGQVPVIQDAWTYVCDAQQRKAEEKALSYCLSMFTKCLGDAQSMHAFQTTMSDVRQSALTMYQDLCASLHVSADTVELEKKVDELMQSYTLQFQTKYHTIVSQAVFASVSALEARSFTDMAEFRKAVAAARAQFASVHVTDDDTFSADAQWYSRVEQLLWHTIGSVYGNMEFTLQALRTEHEKLQNQMQVLVQRHSSECAEREHVHQQALEGMQEAHKFVVEELQAEQRECQQRLQASVEKEESVSAELAQVKREYSERVSVLEQDVDREKLRANGFLSEVEMLREELEDVQQDNAKAAEQARLIAELTLEKDRLRGEASQLRRELADERKSFHSMEQSLLKESKEMQAKALHSLSVMKETRRAEQAQLRSARDDAVAKCTSLESMVAALRAEVDTLKREKEDAAYDAEQQSVRLRNQLESSEQRLAQSLREHTARLAEHERAQRERDRAGEQALQQCRDEKQRVEEECMHKVQMLEKRLARSEAGEAENRRQVELLQEQWQRRKRARADEEGSARQLDRDAEVELLMLRQEKTSISAEVARLRKDNAKLESEKKGLERSLDFELYRQRCDYEARIAELEKKIIMS